MFHNVFPQCTTFHSPRQACDYYFYHLAATFTARSLILCTASTEWISVSLPSLPLFSVYDQVCLLLATMIAKHQPPLMKKHSQTDLVSRLKSRKVLGVGGEDDDGEIHRSKVRVFALFPKTCRWHFSHGTSLCTLSRIY